MHFRAVALLLVAAATATAQAPTLQPNTPVRVNLTDRTVINGILTSQTADTAFVWSSLATGNQAIAWASVQRVRVSTGRTHSAGAAKGFKAGAISGGIVGVCITVIAAADALSAGEKVGDFAPVFFTMTLGGALGGAFYGTIIGFAVGAQTWETVYPGAAPGSLQRTGGPKLGLSLRF